MYASLRQASRKCIKQGRSPSLKLTNLAGLASQLALGLCLALSPEQVKSPGLQMHTGFFMWELRG